MDEQEVIKNMQNMLGRSKMAQTNKPIDLQRESTAPPEAIEPVVMQLDFKAWLKTLPDVIDNQFLLDIPIDKCIVVFCVSELDWQTAMNIDLKAFRTTDNDVDYYSEEYERRHTLSRAIVWIADEKSQNVVFNKDGYVLERLQYDVIDALWHKYKAITSVTTQEAQKLYEATIKYLNNQAQEGVPIPSIIPETIAICDGWSSLSLKELKDITAGDWERMQIVRMARADVMGIYTERQVSSNSTTVIDIPEIKDSSGFDFDTWKNRFPIGHPNRPPD
jgi:hypothetical protein